jgi:hypothetical protein
MMLCGTSYFAWNDFHFKTGYHFIISSAVCHYKPIGEKRKYHIAKSVLILKLLFVYDHSDRSISDWPEMSSSQ